MFTDEVIVIPHPDSTASCHVIVAPRRHVPTFYDLDVAEQRRVWDVVGELQKRIGGSLRVDGFHVGFADGDETDPDAHAHLHVIPRIAGEPVALPDGVEWVKLDS